MAQLQDRGAHLVSAVGTPVGRFPGGLASFSATDLGGGNAVALSVEIE
jgi:hypothetical protein